MLKFSDFISKDKFSVSLDHYSTIKEEQENIEISNIRELYFQKEILNEGDPFLDDKKQIKFVKKRGSNFIIDDLNQKHFIEKISYF